MTNGLKVGIGAPRSAMTGPIDQRQKAVAAVADAGLDHLGLGDHVSFYVGVGFDALIQAAALSSLHDSIELMTSVYLLPLRHPVPVARQLASLSEMAPGRLVFGVGIGGEDPHEVEICGVDPRTRGRRMEESLEIVQGLLTGEPVDFHGEFFDLDRALILPAPSPRIPVLVGGRSDAAVRRTGRLADGWLGIWCSVNRFTQATGLVAEAAGEAGRGDVDWQHAMYVWCGFGPDTDTARGRVSRAMESFYQLPFEKFDKYTPYGTPEQVAEFLAPYRDAGCTRFHLSGVAGDDAELVESAAEVKRLLS